ncbi:MAG: peptidoglycan DD-metalloendopeptidase family protein [Leptolyngbya sp. SIO3F4]|nr:peptidoglycan DD-metalloendopeptidase family protein [Leptolyngbya sp. SIO3F4]
MKRANSQEPQSETSHSCFSDMGTVSEQAPSAGTSRSKSAAMLGLALSFGASGVLFADSEATAAVSSFTATNSTTSSESPPLPSVLRQVDLNTSRSQGLAVYHTVEQGDSLWQIAKEHQVEVQDLKIANRISPDSPLQVGQVIKVPNEEQRQPTLVSLLPGVQKSSYEQTQTPNLENLIASIASSDTVTEVHTTKKPAANEESAVVASEELTGDTSLRSAGLVSNSDGFQADLEQLASRVPAVEAAHADVSTQTHNESWNETVSQAQDITDSTSEGYRVEVRPGDTVEEIALALGTTSEKLVEANDLEDPDFILAGETLALPEEVTEDLVISETVTSLAQVAPEITAISPGIGGFDGTRLSRLQSTVENRIDASSLLEKLQSAQASAISETASSIHQVEAEEVSIDDPYTADLLADVSSAQEISESSSNTEIALHQPAQLGDVSVVNPEFQKDQLQARVLSDETLQNSELLAAAPLDPSVYVSSPAPAAGQVVSPEMPILPSSDEYLPEAPDYFNGYIWPTRGTLTSGYGWRWGRMHRGIDVAGPVGTPIVSAASGIVERAGWNSGGYGNLVEVRHSDGSMTRYAHNSRIVVRSGQRVAQGQHIADMGSTGYSTGPHLHFEVHLPNRGTVNPMAMLPGR